MSRDYRERWELARRAIHWLLFVVTVAFVVTGLGITEARTVEALTLGLLIKPVAFKLHLALTIPFLVLLVVHLGLVFFLRRPRS